MELVLISYPLGAETNTLAPKLLPEKSKLCAVEGVSKQVSKFDKVEE